MAVARVQARGQVTVPLEIRDACGIKPGSDLVFIVNGADEFTCRVLPPRLPLDEVIEKYTVDGQAPDITELHEAMASDMTEHRAR